MPRALAAPLRWGSEGSERILVTEALTQVGGVRGAIIIRVTSMKKGKIHIGTSGWHYKHWTGTFYPGQLKAKDQFAFYSSIFDTVEINNSFYRLPDAKTFTAWKDAAPKNFLFAVKASRFITHMKKLKMEPESIRIFFNHTAKLKEKLGPVLFQLPPGWKVNAERLETFLRDLPKGFSYTIECRNQTWYTDEIYKILRKNSVAFCIYELEHHTSPKVITADFVYIRLHGPGAKYQGLYPDTVLLQWADDLLKWSGQGKDVYLYFDNDQEGFAASNARTLKEMISLA